MTSHLRSPDVTAFLEARQLSEARGDASNLKGTDYHLLYALWLLLCGDAREVAFFAGNDLLSSPIAPVSPADALNSVISLRSSEADVEDVWIQLKCTTAPWTCS